MRFLFVPVAVSRRQNLSPPRDRMPGSLVIQGFQAGDKFVPCLSPCHLPHPVNRQTAMNIPKYSRPSTLSLLSFSFPTPHPAPSKNTDGRQAWNKSPPIIAFPAGCLTVCLIQGMSASMVNMLKMIPITCMSGIENDCHSHDPKRHGTNTIHLYLSCCFVHSAAMKKNKMTNGHIHAGKTVREKPARTHVTSGSLVFAFHSPMAIASSPAPG